MKRPRLLLVNPWIHDFAAYDLWARPMGLLVLGTVLRENGWEPEFLDCLDQDHPDSPEVKLAPHARGRFASRPIERPAGLEHIPRRFSRYGLDPEIVRKDLAGIRRPHAVLVTSVMTYWHTGVRETVSVIKEAFPDVPVLLGGVYATLLPEHAKRTIGADRVIEGPGEQAVLRALRRITGLGCTGNSVPKGPEFRPALDLCRTVRVLPLLTSRGCPFRCSYCASRRIGPAFRQRSPTEVAAEIEDAAVRFGVGEIALYDDAFLVSPETHALPILEAAAERTPGLSWHSPNGLHVSAIDDRVAVAMKRAGFETIRIGFESASDDFHRRTGAKTNYASFVSAARSLREAGFDQERIGAYLLVGLPGQTAAMIEEDVDRALEAGAHPRLAEFSPIPGADMWPEAIKASRYPIAEEPLFQNCTLLPTAEVDVTWEFLRKTRRRIREEIDRRSAPLRPPSRADRRKEAESRGNR